MKEYQTFLKQFIEDYSPRMILAADEQKTIKLGGVKNYILQKINSSKYKGSSYPEELRKKIDNIVAEAIKFSRPIHFTIPFGGFKNPRLPSYSTIDWAELFNIVQMRNFALEIAKGYEPGVIIHYVSDEVFIGRMNNMPQEDLDNYNNRMYMAIAYMQQFCPSNVQLRYSKIRDEISQKEILRRFDEGIVKLREEWGTLPESEREKRLAKSSRNFRGAQTLKGNELKQKMLESTLVHDAFIFSDWEQGVPWAFGPDMIPVGFRYTNKWGIHLKSSPSSTVQFWVGYGVLEKRGSKYIPSILTYNQFVEKKDSIVMQKTEVIPSGIIARDLPVCGE